MIIKVKGPLLSPHSTSHCSRWGAAWRTRRRSTRPCPARPASTTTCSAARTTSPPTVRRRRTCCGSPPTSKRGAQANRRFLIRAVEYMTQQGIRQFLDIGAGLPTQENVHQVALRHAPDSRVVYVDNDPIVLVHARALLADEKRVVAVEGDLRRPESILDNPQVTKHIDLGQPVGLLLVAVLHFIPDEAAYPAVAQLRDRLAPRSHLPSR